MYISNCEFENMTVGKQGGAIYSQNIANMSISRATFKSTISQYSGNALYIYQAALVDLAALEFVGFCHNAIYIQSSPLILYNASFISIILIYEAR